MAHASELNRRGVALKQQGDFAAAAACYEQALRFDPACAEAEFNLGLLRRDLGRIDQAIGCLERAATLRPDVPIVQIELGQLYLSQHRWIDAERVFEQLSRSQSVAHDATLCLAFARQQQGRLVEAILAYRRVLEQEPRHAVALTNLGNVLKAQGQLAEAIQCYQHAIEADPLLVEAHVNLGNSWLELGQFDAAYAEYLLAADLQPTNPQTHVNLGNVLQRLERVTEAAEAYGQAIKLDPNHLDAWISTNHLYREIGNFDQSRAVCDELAHRQPTDPIHSLRAVATCPLVFRSRAELEEYREHFSTLVPAVVLGDSQIDFDRWSVYAPECPYNLQFLDGNLRPLKTAFAQIYAEYFARMPDHLARNRSGKPRIGFVVTAKHERAFLKLLGGVVDRLDGDRWELFLICSRLGAEQIRHGLRNPNVSVVSFPERFDHIVATVRDTACDILYYWEVGNDPTNYFLPFMRLAPIQVTSWGIQVTTGIPNVDYYLSSRLVEGTEAVEHYSERLVLSSTLLTYQTPVILPLRAKQRTDFGFHVDQHLYGCIQNLGKFHPDFDPILADILRRDPLGVVVAARDRNGFAAEILQARWRAEIPDVAARLIFVDPLVQSDYLSLLAACDVLLDPPHFGGVTTTYDAIALRQPVVTLPTPFHRGRYTAGCLQRIGVTDTIACDRDDYVRIAIELACDTDQRQAIRERLQISGPEAFEDQTAIREHERIFEELLARGR